MKLDFNNDPRIGEFKKDWIKDAMKWGRMTLAEANHSWNQQLYKDE
tara:strand:- start:727 stop:864 length:138 start_codon:yes stop_codon:yes gene_type:complete